MPMAMCQQCKTTTPGTKLVWCRDCKTSWCTVCGLESKQAGDFLSGYYTAWVDGSGHSFKQVDLISPVAPASIP